MLDEAEWRSDKSAQRALASARLDCSQWQQTHLTARSRGPHKLHLDVLIVNVAEILHVGVVVDRQALRGGQSDDV